jgi:hypothetical protein
MRMEITLLLSDALATTIANREPSVLDAPLTRYHASLRALHPGSADAQLRRYYLASLPEAHAAEQLRAELAHVSGVEAAYVKPEASAP